MATTPTPTPLPLPQVSQPQNPLGLALEALARSVPNVDPEVATGIAQTSQTPAQAVVAGQAAQGFTDATNLKAQLEQQDSASQRQYWSELSATQQKSLTSAGYKPPKAPGRSIWGDITHGLGQAGHDVLNAAGAPLRAEQHVERTLFATANQTAGAGETGSWGQLFSSFVHPTEWARAWNETSNGQHYILPYVQDQVLKKYGQSTFNLAKELATGTTAAQLVAKAPQAQQQQLAQEIQGDPKLKAAVNELMGGHVSTGRMLVRSLGINENSKAGTMLSGSTDGLLDWFGDPVVVGAKAAQAWRMGHYFVQTGADVMNAYKSDAGVQRAMQTVADHAQYNRLDAAGLFHVFPRLSPMSDQLAQAAKAGELDTADKAAEFFAAQQDVGALTRAQPVSVAGVHGGMMPHLSKAGELRLSAKGVLQKAIDYGADLPARIDGVGPNDVVDHQLTAQGQGVLKRIEWGAGAVARKLTTLTPKGNTFDALDPNWFNNLRDLAMTALPRARAATLLNEYANAATLAGRRQVYVGLLKEVMNAMGIDKIPGVSDWMNSVTDVTSDASPLSHQMYAPGGKDLIWREGSQHPAGVLRPDMTEQWAMPDFKTLYSQSKKLAISRAVNGAVNNTQVDKVMNTIWKPATLARFGFATRVAGEEAFGMLLRDGPMAYAKAHAAMTMARNAALTSGDIAQGHLAGTWDMLTAHLPGSALARIKTPADLIVEHMADYTHRAMANVAGVLAGERYREAVRYMVDQGIMEPDGAFGRYVSSSEKGPNMYDQIRNDLQSKTVWKHGRWQKMYLSKTGAFTGYKPAGELFTNYWYKRLHAIGIDPWAQTALETRNLPEIDRLNAVAGKMLTDKRWLASERSLGTRDGSMVADGTVTQHGAAIDHAKVLIDLVDELTSHVDGTPIEGLADHILQNGKPPTVAALDQIPVEERPAAVAGPEMMPAGEGPGMWTKGVNRMFSTIGKQIDWISRQPMFIHNMAVSLDAYKPLMRAWTEAGVPEERIASMLKEGVTDRALKLTIPFIHDPAVRSQFEVVTRNLSPFMFAQEQFYKRWARTMVQAPWAFRQAQLINQGVYHSGFTHTDPTTGQQYFIYPGASEVQNALTGILSSFGYKSYLPIEAALRGQVKMASPGLERLGLPNVGPLLVVPMNVVKSMFPELQKPVNSLEGPSSTESDWQAFLPTTAFRLGEVAFGNQNNDEQYASAMMQAMQYLDATGHGVSTPAVTDLGTFNQDGPPPNDPKKYKPGDYMTDQRGNEYVVQGDGQWQGVDPADQTILKQRIQNWTRIFLLTRTLFGFNAPASPESLFDPNNVNEQFQALLKELPYNQAVAAFMKLNPDATPYTVFQTTDQAGSYLPSTASAMQFTDQNAQFIKDHASVAGFFVPLQDQTGNYSSQAHQEQLAQQLRVRRTPDQYWQEVAYEAAATPYFAAEQVKNQMLNADPGQRTAIDAAWTAQSQQFMAANPLFYQQLYSQNSAADRSQLEDDLANALNDPNVPEGPQTEQIRTLLNAYVQYQAYTGQGGSSQSNTMSSAQRYQIELAFATQAIAYVQANPATQAMFDRLIRPDISSAMTQLGSSL